MNKKVTNRQVSLRFRRWSRAGYALFVSFTLAVTIGVLAVSICEKSEVKALSSGILNNENAFLALDENEQEFNDEMLMATEIASISATKNDLTAAHGRKIVLITRYFINQNG